MARNLYFSPPQIILSRIIAQGSRRPRPLPTKCQTNSFLVQLEPSLHLENKSYGGDDLLIPPSTRKSMLQRLKFTINVLYKRAAKLAVNVTMCARMEKISGLKECPFRSVQNAMMPRGKVKRISSPVFNLGFFWTIQAAPVATGKAKAIKTRKLFGFSRERCTMCGQRTYDYGVKP